MADPELQRQQPQDDGYVRACEGILRSQFGRRPCSAAARAIEQLAREASGVGVQPEKQRSHWQQAVVEWIRGHTLVWGSAVAVVALAAGLIFYNYSHSLRLQEIGSIARSTGSPTLRQSAQGSPRNGNPGSKVYLGDRVETGDADKAELVFKDGTTLRLNFNTVVEIPKVGVAKAETTSSLVRPPQINLIRGQIWTKVQKLTNAPQYAIRTEAATAVARGTEFGVKIQRSASTNASAQATVLTVKEGAVDFSNSHGSVEAVAMTESTASVDSAPSRPVRLQTIRTFDLTQDIRLDFGTLLSVFDLDRWMYRMVYPQGWAGFWLRSVIDPEGGTIPQLRVVRVWPKSPAEQAGLVVGDVITQVNGQTTTNIQEVLRTVFRQQGATVTLSILRGKSPKIVSLQTTQHPYALPFTDVPPGLDKEIFDGTWPMIDVASQGEITTNEWLQVAQQFGDLVGRYPKVAALHNNLGVWCDLWDEVGPAIQHLGSAVGVQPGSPLYHYNLGMVLTGVGNVERAAEEAEAVVRISPDWVPGVVQLSEIYNLLDRHEEALAIGERGLRTHPSCPDLWVAKSFAFLNLDRQDEALAAALTAVALEPSYGEWWWRLHLVYEARGERAASQAAVLKVIEQDPGNAPAYDALAIATMRQLGDRLPGGPADASPDELSIDRWINRPAEELATISEAERLERKAIALMPGHGSFYRNLGHILLSRGAVDEADRALGIAMELDPSGQGAAAPNTLAYYFAIWGIRLDEALRLAQRAAQLDPGGPTFDTLAAVHFRRGEFDQAEAAWKKCIESAGPKGDPGAWYHLGRLYEKKNQPDPAIKAYEEALRFKPDFPEASRALERLRQ